MAFGKTQPLPTPPLLQQVRIPWDHIRSTKYLKPIFNWPLLWPLKTFHVATNIGWMWFCIYIKALRSIHTQHVTKFLSLEIKRDGPPWIAIIYHLPYQMAAWDKTWISYTSVELSHAWKRKLRLLLRMVHLSNTRPWMESKARLRKDEAWGTDY